LADTILNDAMVNPSWSLTAAWRRRRVRLAAAVLGAVLVLLGLELATPEVRILPEVAGVDRPGAVLLLLLMAMGCEYIDSSLGMGYGTALTPLLVLAGFDPMRIVPCVLFSECVTGLAAGLMHHRDGNVDFLRDRQARLTTVLLTALSAVGACAAVMLAVRIDAFWMGMGIVLIVLAMGAVTLLTFRRPLRYRRSHIVAVGAVAAFNKAFSGGGYGPLVTAGQVVSGLPARHAVAVSSLAESAVCVIGLVAYLAAGKRLDWTLAAPLTAGALMSVPLATLTVRKLPETLMRVGVGLMTLILGIVALVKLLG